MKKDPALLQFMQTTPCVKHSDKFTKEVMTQLPKRNPLQGWGLAFLLLLWSGFITWVWFWHTDLVRVLMQTNWSLHTLRIEPFIPYIAFLMGLGLLLWQTCDYFVKLFSRLNGLKHCVLSGDLQKQE
ncbi:MAG: hypothetical protein RR837_12925 [Bacteroidales bacterium]